MTDKTYKRGRIKVWSGMTLLDLKDIVAKAKSLGLGDDDKISISSGDKQTIDKAVRVITDTRKHEVIHKNRGR